MKVHAKPPRPKPPPAAPKGLVASPAGDSADEST